MKANLLFKDRNLILNKELDYGMKELIEDLELEMILKCMSQDDSIIYKSCKDVLLNPLEQLEIIEYRQSNLRDALSNKETIRQLYEITNETEKKRKSSWRWISMDYLSITFSNSVDLLSIYIEMLYRLRLIADSSSSYFKSDGFTSLMNGLRTELSDEYLSEVKEQLKELKQTDNTFISSSFGSYLQGVKYYLRKRNRKNFWMKLFFSPSFTIAARDESGAKDIEKRRERAINEATNALAQATEHLESFFALLRSELAFYVGCINLSEFIDSQKMPYVIPNVDFKECLNRSWESLYDLSLLTLKQSSIIGNEHQSSHKSAYLITGANQGGKTTFLRSMGQAQLMAQCGMFVSASEFTCPIRVKVFTHFKQEEDKTMSSGKLDEEMSRMSACIDHLYPYSMVLLNESFASTNEIEGSDINSQITKAFIENKVEVFAVTHLMSYANRFVDDERVEFLRAERKEDGTRTYKIKQGLPLTTAFGEDIYKLIFDKE